MRKIFLLILGISCVLNSNAQIKVDAYLDTLQILIGDQVLVHYNIYMPEDAQIKNVAYQGVYDSLEYVDLLNIYSLKNITSQQTGAKYFKQSLQISSYDSGTYVIPGVEFDIQLDNQLYKATSNSVVLDVHPVNLSENLLPIKDILDEKRNWRDYLKFAAIPLVAILAFFLFLFIRSRIKNMKSKEEAIPEVIQPQLPAHEIAKQKLDDLLKQELWQNNQVKEYYAQVSLICREYIENRFEVNAVEDVTFEIIPNLKKHPEMDKYNLETLRNILTDADMVKFAKVKPNEEKHQQIIEDAYRFVKNTKKIEIIKEDFDADGL